MACKKNKRSSITNLVVVSDMHAGCRLGLCPSDPQPLDDGGHYTPSACQKKVWAWWEEFWGEWVPEVTHGEPYAVVVNGDALDGVHHKATTQVSNNLGDQAAIADSILRPIVTSDMCTHYYHIRGTEAHVGPSGVEEERLARSLGSIKDEAGRSARYELWVKVGRGLVHVAHHIGTTGRTHYESSAVMAELGEAYAEAGRWGERPPDVVVRAHRHRSIEIRIPTSIGYGIALVTPGWQLKTPFVYRIAGGRTAPPQFGGAVIRQGDQDLFTRHRVWTIGRPAVEELQ